MILLNVIYFYVHSSLHKYMPLKITFNIFFFFFSGQNVSLECSGIGKPVPSATWRRVQGVLQKDRLDSLDRPFKVVTSLNILKLIILILILI